MRAFFTTAFLLVLLFGFQLDADAQKAMRRFDSIPVIHGTDTLAFPWVGGLNSPQIGHVYLDGDTFPDLVIFDRGYYASSRFKSGHRLLTFINNGIANEASYTYAPRYEAWFPKVNHWMLLRDFNCDGISDIVTYGDTTFNEYWLYMGNRVNDSMYYTYRGELWCTDGYNIPAKINDIPAVLDVNGDGDLDILMLENWTGAVIQYFENNSIEGGGSCGDSISFDLMTNCWGGFEESPLNNQIKFNQPCLFPLAPGGTVNNGPGGNRHVDGTLLDLDVDGNGYTDLLLGDPGYPTMTLVVNSQPNDSALMVPPSDSLFPIYDTTINIRRFPMAAHLDLDNDGRKDLVAANNMAYPWQSDDPVWFYKDTSSTDTIRFNLRDRNFLKDEMIDLGFGASPAFVDVNADSLIDLVIGNFSQAVDTIGGAAFQSSLYLYLNVGTSEVPAFELQDDNWLNISAIRPANPYYDLKPCFADLDGDNDKDLLLGEANGTILYFENTAAAGAPAVYTLAEDSLGGIDVGNNSAPFVYDVDGDQVPDLLVGRIQGNIHYFQNRGTATAPLFDPVPSNFFFGQIDAFAGAAAYNGHSTPIITTLDDTSSVLYLLSGNDDGHIVGYAFNADSVVSGSMTKLFDKYSGIDVGERSAIAIADLTNDGKWEMVVGSYRGGLQFYTLSDSIASTDTTGIGFIDAPLPGVEVYPNPVQNTLQVSWDNISSEYLYISIIDLSGKILHQRTELSVSGSGISTVDLSGISGGIYICRVTSGGRSVNKKIIVLQE